MDRNGVMLCVTISIFECVCVRCVGVGGLGGSVIRSVKTKVMHWPRGANIS